MLNESVVKLNFTQPLACGCQQPQIYFCAFLVYGFCLDGTFLGVICWNIIIVVLHVELNHLVTVFFFNFVLLHDSIECGEKWETVIYF